MRPVAGPTGCYGKLPARGDFLSRRLSASFVQSWDAWLQRALQSSRDILGAHWLERYLSAPLWRFALAPGVAGGQPMAGVFLPSVDRVGRYFPFAIASPVAGRAIDLVRTLVQAEPWFDALQEVALQALDPALAVDAFDARIEALVFPAHCAVPNRDSAWRASSEERHAAIEDEAASAGVLERLVKGMTPGAAWLSCRSEISGSHAVATGALPSGEMFCSMLDGEWQRHSSPASLHGQALERPG
ncbi:MAG: type VI secretion-associated protein [Betaproteobacteria bacterium RIFCSPLOWO2_02_FULL_65_24]|nr:MAG: type VI secretion-associated protein [Betaproteobacteria bacterium RIFCSPLOWO2_02_FULL_65_24]OGA72719.1 MAG: type VI secretion-associated protein [Betaproteobacteria bacterium RIFCSPLOWO2_12_FULL_66_14]